MILLCYDKLASVIESFEQATGWKTVLMDADGRTLVVTPYRANSFCSELQRLSGCDLCKTSDQRLIERCRESHDVEMHVCHAGLTDLCVPLLEGERLLGFLMFGQIRRELAPPDESVFSLFSDREVGRTLYERTPVIGDERLFAVIRLSTMLASYILGEQMIRERHTELSERVSTYVRSHLGEHLTVSRIAHDLHLSRSALYRVFDENIGTGVMEYVTAHRIDTAKEMLAHGELSVGEIAVLCGIDNTHYFSRLFKKKTGKSPLQYRKNVNNQ